MQSSRKVDLLQRWILRPLWSSCGVWWRGVSGRKRRRLSRCWTWSRWKPSWGGWRYHWKVLNSNSVSLLAGSCSSHRASWICHWQTTTTINKQQPMMDQPLSNDYPDGLASCKWSSGWTGLLQMIIWIGRPLANNHPDGPASCKWSSELAGLLQMIIQIERAAASCKWSSGWTGLMQLIIRMDHSLANDLPDGQASCKWSSGWGGLLQMIIWNDWPLANDHLDGSVYCKWSTG